MEELFKVDPLCPVPQEEQFEKLSILASLLLPAPVLHWGWGSKLLPGGRFTQSCGLCRALEVVEATAPHTLRDRLCFNRRLGACSCAGHYTAFFFCLVGFARSHARAWLP